MRERHRRMTHVTNTLVICPEVRYYDTRLKRPQVESIISRHMLIQNTLVLLLRQYSKNSSGKSTSFMCFVINSFRILMQSSTLFAHVFPSSNSLNAVLMIFQKKLPSEISLHQWHSLLLNLDLLSHLQTFL